MVVTLHFNSYFSFILQKHIHVTCKYIDVYLCKTFGKFHLLLQHLFLINGISKKLERENDSFVLKVIGKQFSSLSFTGERVKTACSRFMNVAAGKNYFSSFC